MSALPSPSGSGPQRPDPAHGSSRHAHRAPAPEAAGAEVAEHGDPGDGSWFTVVLRGYDRGQVEARLTDLDDRIHEEVRRADTAEQALSDARAQVRRLQEQVARAAAEPVERRAEDAGFGHRVERVLQAAEQEAAELRDRAAADADEIVSRAREEAEDRRTRTEEALLGRASTLDREFASRSAALDDREQDADRREHGLDLREDEIAERERTVEERVGSVREEADRIIASARADADEILAAARDESADALRAAERDAGERRAAMARDVERLAGLRNEVRGELARARETLTTELDREPVAATLDNALFGGSSATTSETSVESSRPSTEDPPMTDVDPRTGSLPGSSSSSTGTSFVWSSGTGADRTGTSAESGASTSGGTDATRSGPAGAAGAALPDSVSAASSSSAGAAFPGSAGSDLSRSAGTARSGPAPTATSGSRGTAGLSSTGSARDDRHDRDDVAAADDADADADADADDTATGTLLLGPGRRPGTARDDDPDRTTIGQIPPISLTSIGVLPFGDLGTGRESAGTRNDGAGNGSRPHRGPTRGPGPGRRSR